MFSEPEKNIEQIGLQEGDVVADLGAGPGAYSIAAAKALNGTGRVYAIDVQKNLLTTLKSNVRDAEVGNVEALWANIEKIGGTKLRESTVDVVILSNVLFQVEDKKTVIEEAKRILKPGGRILVIDWSASHGHMGPTPEKVFKELDAKDLLEKLGLTVERHISAGNYHYGIVVQKPKRAQGVAAEAAMPITPEGGVWADTV